ncbi:hypothetical protein [Nocardioides sp. T2.26MG-1]|uniref:hypothetical protein n=1 Tax=Nocardioides sp. T2.26MG-1 TaxID=3041166 RepID=UPI0024773126|nr:hypothetical protein [Nocardioides sp. T2.26MG-1]CAI9415632.1 hypothetical protein HIDPHFAB_02571 [Nocardioides sp. T2.26MG-1]
MTLAVPHAGASPDAWFRRRPPLTWAVVVALFAGIFALRLSGGTVEDAYSMLYVFPVALVAVAFGRRAGTAAGVVAVALIVVWAVTRDVGLDPLGWASRVLPILLLGLLVGDATDRVRRTESERRRLESAALLHRDAIEINDSLVQGMVAAKWSLEAGNLDAGLSTLNATITQAHELVSGLIRQAGMGGRTEQLPPRE